MMMTYDINYENKTHDLRLEIAELTWQIYRTAAKHLGITLDEYIDFTMNMQFETKDYSLDEIEGMYAEYCREYDIPCMQIDISNPMKLLGAI